MKQIILSLILATVCFGFAKADVKINEANFPDKGFREWIWNFIPGAEDGVLTDAEISLVKDIDITYDWYTKKATAIPTAIYSIEGIGYFTELESLAINNSLNESYRPTDKYPVAITSVDLTNNKKLKHFHFCEKVPNITGTLRKLQKMNIEGLSDLETLYVYGNAFSKLNCAGCEKLKSVTVLSGVVSSFNFEGCVNLETIDLSRNNISELRLPSLPKLKTLNCGTYYSNEGITVLDLSPVPNLEHLDCTTNKITKLDLSVVPKLKYFACKNNQISDLNLAPVSDLEYLDCSYNQLSELDLSVVQKLKTLKAISTSISSLALDNCAELEELNCSWNSSLKTLSMSQCPNLKKLICNNTLIEDLPLRGVNPLLKYLNCSNTPIKCLETGHLTALDSINFSNCTQMETFPSLPSKIKAITCSNSPVGFEIKSYPSLIRLYANNCEIYEFDASKCPNLTDLQLTNNHLMELDLTPLKSLGTGGALFNFNQQIVMPTVKHTEGSEVVWKVTMPASFNYSRIIGKSANYEIKKDEDGLNRYTFILQDRKPLNTEKGAFYYLYKNYGDQNIPARENLRTTVWVIVRESSGVEDVSENKVVSGVRYYDLQGHESAEPFNGFNIEVTHYTDGTSQSKKFIR